MPNRTITIILTKNEWTQVADAGDSVLLTPVIADARFIVRYQELKPAQIIGIGHSFKKDSENCNLIVGGFSLDNGWMKAIYPEETDVRAEKTVLD